MIRLKNHFEYLHKLAEDRALKVIKTVVDGEGERANRMDTNDQPHRRHWVAVALGGGSSVGNALHSLQLDEQIVPRSARVNTCCKLTGICHLHQMTRNSQETLIKCFALIGIG